MWAYLTLASLVAAPPPGSLFVFELEGVPVGVVRLSLEGNRYRYLSSQLFSRGQRASRSVQLQVDEHLRIRGTQVVPESLWLWRRPGPGCVAGRDELGETEGPLCVTQAGASRAAGTVFGEPFTASYGEDGLLTELRIGPGRFRRLEREQVIAIPPDLWAAGFPIQGKEGALALVPPRPGRPRSRLKPWALSNARDLAAEIQQDSPAKAGASLGDGPCLTKARRFVEVAGARGGQGAVVIGLLEEGGRAYPHAWVRVALPDGGEIELDPSSPAQVSARTHLPLEGGGRDLLELLSGRLRVERRRGGL